MANIQLLQGTEKIKDSYGKINTSLTNLNNAKMEKTADSDLNMNNRAITNLLALNIKTSGANLTISSGAITVTQGYHVVDTEGSAPTDDLTTINGGNTGDSLILRQANASRNITIKSGVGNIRTFDGLDIVMSTDNSMVELLKVGNNWVVKGYVPVHDQYPLPLAAGMTDYNTIDSGYACVIFRRGRMVTVIFMLTKDSGNFSGNELFATLPAGLRPAGRCKFAVALYNAPNPTQGTSTFVGMADGTVYVGGEMRVNPHSMTGNRIGGTITFAI